MLGIEATREASCVFDGGKDIPQMGPFMADARPLPGGVLEEDLRGGTFRAAMDLVEARSDAGNAGRLAIAEVGAGVYLEGVEFGVLERTPAVGGQVLRLDTAGGPVGELVLPLQQRIGAPARACVM